MQQTVTDVLCHGGNAGSIAVAVSGGSGSYYYSWSSGDTTSSAQGLTAGDYVFAVSDTFNCEIRKVFTVGEPSIISFFQPFICNLLKYTLRCYYC